SVVAIALAPDGRLLATSSLDETVRLWDLETGRQVFKLAGHVPRGRKLALGFSADGKRLLSWGADFSMRIWDVTTGKAVQEHAPRPAGVRIPGEANPMALLKFLSSVGAAAFTADGKTFLMTVGATVYRFDVATGKEVGSIATGYRNVQALAVSPDGTRMLAS